MTAWRHTKPPAANGKRFEVGECEAVHPEEAFLRLNGGRRRQRRLSRAHPSARPDQTRNFQTPLNASPSTACLRQRAHKSKFLPYYGGTVLHSHGPTSDVRPRFDGYSLAPPVTAQTTTTNGQLR